MVPQASTSIGNDGDYLVVTVTGNVDDVPFVGSGDRTPEADAAMRREDLAESMTSIMPLPVYRCTLSGIAS